MFASRSSRDLASQASASPPRSHRKGETPLKRENNSYGGTPARKGPRPSFINDTERVHRKKPSISFADLDYDDKFKTIAHRKQGKTITVLGQYQLVEKVGKGAFGIVYKALHFETGNHVAIKRLSKEGINEKMLLNLKGEIDLLKTLDHKHIVKYLGLVDSDNHINMILEFVENGSLLQMINKLGVFPESLAAIYAAQMLKGLIYLHEKNVTHRDIKASNILITLDGLVKLADFGIATTGNAGDGDQSDLVEGSPFWMAPEIIQLDPPSTACDIWSLGCTVLELITGEPPYFDMPAMSALFKIVQDDHPPIPDTFSEGLQDFLLCCFKKEPSERATATQLLNHPWIRNSSPILNGLSELSLRDAQSTVRLHNNGAGSDKESGSSGSGSSRSGTNGRSSTGRCSLRSIDWGSSSNDSEVANSFEHAAIDDVDEWEKPSRPSNIRVQDISSRFEESVGYVVLITGFETRKNKLMSYTVFRLKVCLGKETWRIYKTYTDFKDMHTQLRARLKKTKRKGGMPKFPSGKMFGADKEDFVKKRKQKLQTYISEILKIPEVMKTGLLTDFLKTNGQDVMSLGFQKEVEEEPLPERERKPSVHARTSLRAKEKKARQNVEREIGEWTVEDRAIDREEGEQTPH